jgi:hypothetical protein
MTSACFVLVLFHLPLDSNPFVVMLFDLDLFDVKAQLVQFGSNDFPDVMETEFIFRRQKPKFLIILGSTDTLFSLHISHTARARTSSLVLGTYSNDSRSL